MPDLIDRAQRASERHVAESLARHHYREQESISCSLCIECDEPIPDARQQAVPGCQRCVDCQYFFEGGR